MIPLHAGRAALRVAATCALVLGCRSVRPDLPASPPDAAVNHGSGMPAHKDHASTSGWGSIIGQPLLDGWIRGAIADSPALAAAAASRRAASARARGSRAERTPAVDATLEVRDGRKQNAMTGDRAADIDPYAIGVSAAWDIDIFGRIRARVGAAQFAEVAARHATEDRKLAMAAELAQRYVGGLFLREQVALHEKTVSANLATLRYLRSRVGAGLELPVKTDRAEARRYEAERRREASAQTLAEAGVRWEYLAGPGIAPPLADAPGELTVELPPVPREQDLHAAVLRRPDVQAASALSQGAEREAVADARKRLPTLALVATAEGDGPSPVEEPEEWLAWAGVRLSLPVLSPGRKADAEERRERAAEQAALYDETVRLALLDVREAYVRRRHSAQRWHAARREAGQLKRRLGSVTRQHEEGLVAVPALEQAREEWLVADERARQLLAATLQHHIALVRASGGPSPSTINPLHASSLLPSRSSGNRNPGLPAAKNRRRR